MLKIIEYNPFRIFGVYSNSPIRDVVKNENKINAFLKVRKDISFPLDLPTFLPAIERNEKVVADAKSQITLPEEKVKYAQFWFINATEIDEIAFSDLIAGNIDEAENLWSKRDTVSSLQNRVIINLIKSDLQKAISLAERLYETFSNDYVKTIDSSLFINFSKKELIQNFLDSICEDIESSTLIKFINNNEWKSYLTSNEVSDITKELNSLVEKAKAVDKNDPILRRIAGTSLMNKSKPLLERLRSYLDINDVQYQMVADKVGLEVLYCAIDHYNKSYNVSLAAQQALTLELYAQETVVGTMAKEKCDTNVKILKNNIENLPPENVFEEDRQIKDLIAEFCSKTVDIEDSIKLLQNAKPYLKSIKSKLGKKNGYYLNISTQVVSNALYVIIAIVNDSQGIDNSSPFGFSRYNVDLSLLDSNLRLAQKANRLMRRYDMEKGYKKSFKRNMNTLDSLCSKLSIPTYYERMGCILIIGAIIIGFLLYLIVPPILDIIKTQKEKTQREEIFNSLDSIPEVENKIKAWKEYKYEMPQDYYFEKLEKLHFSTDSSAWKYVDQIGSIKMYDKYIELYPKGEYRDSAERKVEIKNIDSELFRLYDNEYEELPRLKRKSSGGVSSTVIISNNSNSSIEVLLSGKDSKRISIFPQKTNSISVENDVYRIAVINKTNTKNVSIGVENLDGGNYQLLYNE